MIKELRKLFSSKLTFICLIATLAFLGVFISKISRSQSGNGPESYDTYETLYTEGASEQEILDELQLKTDRLERAAFGGGDATKMQGEYTETLMGDYILFSAANSLADYIYVHIPQERTRIITDSLYNISEENEKPEPDKGVIRSNNRVVELYNRTIPCKLRPTGYFDIMYKFFDNTEWDYVMVALVVILTVRMFTMDIVSGAYLITYSSVKGRKKLFVRQLTAVGAVVTAVIVLNAACQLACGILFCQVKNLSLPIQMRNEYEFCPYLISLGGFLVIKLFAKLIFYFMIIALTAMITVLSRRVILPLAGMLIAGIAPLILISKLYSYSVSGQANGLQFKYRLYTTLRGLLPHSLLNLDPFFRAYDEFSLFGFPVSRLLSVSIVTVLITIACCIVAFNKYGSAKRG